jgi:hypothetical protein
MSKYTMIKVYSYHVNNNSHIVTTTWICHVVLGRAMGNLDSQDSPRPRLGGSHHLSPHSILCASPRSPHPNGILSWDSANEGFFSILQSIKQTNLPIARIKVAIYPPLHEFLVQWSNVLLSIISHCHGRSNSSMISSNYIISFKHDKTNYLLS